MPELKRRRAELEAELAMSIARHQVLTDKLPWEKQLVRQPSCTFPEPQRNLQPCKALQSAWQTFAVKPMPTILDGLN